MQSEPVCKCDVVVGRLRPASKGLRMHAQCAAAAGPSGESGYVCFVHVMAIMRSCMQLALRTYARMRGGCASPLALLLRMHGSCDTGACTCPHLLPGAASGPQPGSAKRWPASWSTASISKQGGLGR